MKKDIPIQKTINVAVAIVKELNELNQPNWDVYLINLKEDVLEQVLVSSKGYFIDLQGNETKTSILRHALGNIQPNSFVKIEPIMENVFSLHNEYWVSYFINGEMFDKKYIFLAETINEKNLINIPLINKKGIMIK